MRQIRLILSIGALLTTTFLFAQEPVILALPDTSTTSGDTLRVDITARQFREIASFQFSFQWNPAVLQYAGFEETNLPIVAVGNANAANGVLRFSWFDINLTGQTLPDNSSIVRLKFFVNGGNGTFTNLTITNTPLAIQIFRSNGTGGFIPATLNPENGSVTVGTQNAFRASFTTTNILCFGANTGTISTTLINKPNGATVRWTGPNNFQSQEEDLSNLPAGTYNLQVANGGNMLLDTIFTLTQPATPLTIDTILARQASCTQPTGSATVTAIGGVLPYRYSLGSNFLNSNQFSNLNPGLYNITVRDSNNCTVSDTFRIRAADALTLSLPDTLAICAGQNTTLDAGAFASYRWSTGATTRSLMVSAPGTYTVTVTNADGCSGAGTTRVMSAVAPQLQLADSISICTGQSIALDAGVHSTYRWSNGATSRTISASTTGTYSVTVTNVNGCSTSDSIRVVPGNNLQLQLADSISICTGQNVTLDAGVFASYRWSNGAMTRTINVSNTGTYVVTVTNTSGCSGIDSIRVVPGNNLQLQLADSISICTGQNVTLDAGVFASYRWSTGAMTRTINVSNTGAYVVTVTDAVGCSGADSIRVVPGVAPLLQLADSISICNGQSRALDAGIHNSYRWSTGATTRTISVSNIGTFAVTVSNAAGCTASDSVRVLAGAAPMLDLGDTTFICNGENVLLDAGMFAAYRWSTGASTRTINVSSAGNFSVTVTNAAGCTAADTVRVLAESFQLSIAADSLEVCPGTAMWLTATLAERYTWIDTSRTLSATNIRRPLARPRTNTRYTLIAENGCGTDTAFVEIKVLKVTATAGPDTCIAPGDELELYASGGVAYFWFLNDYPVSNPNIPNPTVQPEDSTSYFVQITDIRGCQILDTIIVLVANNPLDIMAVNMITPNGDGKNDVLEFKGLEKYGLNTLKVYNRWGDLVYQKINYQKDDERFNGTRNGKLLPTGNYYYVLSFRDGDIKQTLTILRE
ncbi:MAG: gliding motility-associated C-terminal domain-containing protein [Saprospiraceae bacterium]